MVTGLHGVNDGGDSYWPTAADADEDGQRQIRLAGVPWLLLLGDNNDWSLGGLLAIVGLTNTPLLSIGGVGLSRGEGLSRGVGLSRVGLSNRIRLSDGVGLS